LTRSIKRNLKSSRPNKRFESHVSPQSGDVVDRVNVRETRNRVGQGFASAGGSRSGRTRNGTRLAGRLLVPCAPRSFQAVRSGFDEGRAPSLGCKRSCDRNSKETNEIALVIFDSPLYERHWRDCLYQTGQLIPSIGPNISSDLKSALRTAPDHDSRKPRDPRVATILHHGFGCGRRRAGTIDDPNGTDCNWP
jgi:hypothetical protein